MTVGEGRADGARVGLGHARHHHGELLQGAFRDASGAARHGLVTVPMPGAGTRAVFVPDPAAAGITVVPAGRSKAARAARLTAEAVAAGPGGGAPELRGRVELSSAVPIGLGMGSSTGDVVATIRAVADAAGVTPPARVVARLAVASEAACDPTMFDERPILFAHRDGHVLEDLGPALPPLRVLGCLTGGGRPVDTLAVARRYDDADVAEFERLRDLLRRAVRRRDPDLLGAVATASARRHRPGPELEAMIAIAAEAGAVGVQVAHSGNVAGLLFDPTRVGALRRAARALHAHGLPVTSVFGIGDPPRPLPRRPLRRPLRRTTVDDHVSQAVGRPDLVRLDERLICLRFETMKVLSADAAVAHLLGTGAVRPGDTLLDSSSGIYAYALALACHRHGLRCHIVGSTTVDAAVATQLDVLGAHLEQMPPSDDLKLDQSRRVARIRALLAEDPRLHWMRQYHDDVHHLGYRAVAETVRAELGAVPVTVVGGVGSGASTGALAGYLRRDAPDTRLVGVQPFGSITFGSEHVADPEIIIAGIGSSVPFGNVVHSRYDVVHWTGFGAALAGSVDLLRRHAVFAGLSTGAAYLAARWERRLDPARTVLVIAADTGHRYVDTVFARHAEAVPITELAPHEVTGTAELALPWSRMRWAGAPAPPAARVSPEDSPAARRPTPAPP